MSSENGENNENLNDFLAEGAEARSGETDQLKNTVRELEEKIAKIDEDVKNLVAISNDKQDFVFKLNEYIDAAKQDIRFYKRVRIFMIGMSLIFVIFLLALLVCVLFFHQFFFYLQGPYFRSALVLATVGGSVVIISLVLRGVFRLAAEQNAEHQLPPDLRSMLNTANTLNQSQGN
ncbi:MAG: hypothetical protein JJU21_07615 [Salinarimonas sp.]|nr:hypothetical protein [Salinarimonas sp.]